VGGLTRTYRSVTMRNFVLGFAFGLLALLLAVIIAARLGLLPINANTSPSNLEVSFAQKFGAQLPFSRTSTRCRPLSMPND